ncbi:conserved hypothetical protein [Paraburkholderia tropica]
MSANGFIETLAEQWDNLSRENKNALVNLIVN